jgi:hypothetical protein
MKIRSSYFLNFYKCCWVKTYKKKYDFLNKITDVISEKERACHVFMQTNSLLVVWALALGDESTNQLIW